MMIMIMIILIMKRRSQAIGHNACVMIFYIPNDHCVLVCEGKKWDLVDLEALSQIRLTVNKQNMHRSTCIKYHEG